MATQRSAFVVPLTEFAAALLAEREVVPRARITAQQVADVFPGMGVVVYTLEEGQDGKHWTPKSSLEISLHDPTVDYEAGTLGAMAEHNQAVLFAGSDLTREDYAHVNVRLTVVSIATVPLSINEQLIGAIELISLKEPITEDGVAAVVQIAECASIGIANAIGYEDERNSNLEAISRLTQLYDFEKVVNSVMEMDQLIPVVAAKTQELMNVQAVNLWMIQGEELLLIQRQGLDETIEIGVTQSGEGTAYEVSENGEPILIADPEDPRLKSRNSALNDPRPEAGAIYSLAAVPLLDQGSLVGVIEVINKLDSTLFDDDDVFFLSTIAEAAAGALHNASLLEAERRIEYLQILVKVSHEISSTLDLDRVLKTIVNAPQAVIPYQRAAIALEERGKLVLKSVSGTMHINRDDPEIRRLDDLLRWASISTAPLNVRQHKDDVEADREETRAKFKQYFSESGCRGFYAIPLVDDQGQLGIMSFESSDPDFMSEAHEEMIQVLAGQATVALRNAQMYTEVPFIGVLEPLMRKKQRFMRMEKRKRSAAIGLTVLAVAFLVAFPLPFRVDGDAFAAPARTAEVQPEVEGVVQKVLVREGEPVARGAVLATLQDWDYRSALAAAEAKRDASLMAMNKALASNDGAEAGIQRVQLDYWNAEVARARERLERTQIRSPIDGVVTTPHIENFTGRRLQYGDTFGEVVDTSHAVVDVALDEKDVALVRPGEKSAIKLEGFPTAIFRGEVVVVSPRSQAEQDERIFYARVLVPNETRLIRAGMKGQGKVSVGWRPSGYILLRRPTMWAWGKVWNWVGW